jgi:divalent metal cation (Fe/Co/Zn/Cd) transporter
MQQEVVDMMADLMDQGLDPEMLEKVKAANQKFEEFAKLSDDLFNQNMNEVIN